MPGIGCQITAFAVLIAVIFKSLMNMIIVDDDGEPLKNWEPVEGAFDGSAGGWRGLAVTQPLG